MILTKTNKFLTHLYLRSKTTKKTLKTFRNIYPFSIHNSMKTYTSQQITQTHGRTRIDQNATLFASQAKIQQFIKKERELYQSESGRWANRMRKYLERVNERRDERTSSTAQVFNGHQYFTTVDWYEDRQYTKIWRKPISSSSSHTTKTPELVLDIMQHHPLKKHSKTVQLTRTVFSPCSKYIAFGFDLHNNEQISFMIKNIQKNQIVGVKDWEDNRLKGVDNLVFCGDSGIFYTKVIKYRPAQLWFQDIKTGQKFMIYSEKNGEYYLDISMAKDNKHLIVTSSSKQNSKTWTIAMDQILKKPSQNSNPQSSVSSPKITMRQFKTLPNNNSNSNNNTKTYVNHNGKNFVIWRDNQQKSEIVLLDQITNKEKVVYQSKPQDYQTITDVDIFQDKIVLYIRKVVSPIIRIIHLNQKQIQKVQQIQMPYQFGSVHPGANQMLKTDTFLFYLNNIFVFNQGYQYNFITKKVTIRQEFKMTGPKFNVKDYIVSLHQVPAQDGQMVPLTTIVPRKSFKNRNKMLLHCYGHYGLAYQISFNNTYWAALQSGWSLAYAHIRGGGQKGVSWHKQAIKGQKYRNWTDLQDCVAYLIKNQYTHPNILILFSHSAGAITIWNTINRHPHLYKAVIMSYPFLDVLGLLLDSSKPLTQSDYPQFGNPSQSLKIYNEIESYSPYQNIEHNKSYPFIYLVAGTKDYRCPMDQIAKFVKRYRQVRKWNNQEERIYEIGEKGLLVKINQASHEGIADLGEQLENGCQMLACMDFIIQQASKDVTVNM